MSTPKVRQPLRERAREVIREYFKREFQARREAQPHVSWTWEEALADITKKPKSSKAIAAMAASLRKDEGAYKIEKYDDSERFERLLDRIERVVG